MNLQIILCLLLINVNTTEAGDNHAAVKPDSFEELLEALVSFTNYALSFTDKIYYITDKQFKTVDDVKDSENSTKNIKSSELLPGSVVSIRDLHNLSQEVLNGIFEIFLKICT